MALCLPLGARSQKPNAEDEVAESKNDPEHWDVIQDEATRETSKSGLPMLATSSSSEPVLFPATTPRERARRISNCRSPKFFERRQVNLCGSIGDENGSNI
jgi:hypothetical protein